MKIDAVKYSIRGLIKATHIALSKGRENEDKIDEIEGGVESIRDDLPDLVSDEVSNCLGDQVSDQLSDYGIHSTDWKEDLKSEFLDAIADDNKDLSMELDAHGNLITDVEEKAGKLEDKIEKIEVTLAEKIPYLEGTLEEVAGGLSDMESAYCDMPATVESLEEELSLHEHRLGSLERKLGVHPDEFKKDDPKLDELVNAIQKLYELNGIELNFDLGGE